MLLSQGENQIIDEDNITTNSSKFDNGRPLNINALLVGNKTNTTSNRVRNIFGLRIDFDISSFNFKHQTVYMVSNGSFFLHKIGCYGRFY